MMGQGVGARPLPKASIKPWALSPEKRFHGSPEIHALG